MARGRKLHDEFFRRAKDEGYVARSAYKLLEINEKKRILRKGDRVLDLGCAPGSWMQVALELVGPRGRVVGIDLKDVELRLATNAATICGDAFEIDPATVREAAGGPLDVVLSDMAPNTTGAGDHFRSVALCDRVLELAIGLLRPGGNLAMKVFEGESYADLLRRTGESFDKVKGFKPKACRDVSTEIYVIAHGFNGNNGERAS